MKKIQLKNLVIIKSRLGESGRNFYVSFLRFFHVIRGLEIKVLEKDRDRFSDGKTKQGENGRRDTRA